MADVFRAPSLDKSTVVLFRKSVTQYFLVKRFLDFSLAAVLLVAFLPIMAVIAVMIKLDSRGPVFYRQKRVGAQRVFTNGAWTWKIVEFDLVKFRTMFHKADPALHKAYVSALIQNDSKKMDELNGHQSINKLQHDPRITHVGHFLRQYSLDELPQFINVLMGQMSLVGPRPAIRYEVDLYKPWHMGRFNALPGITGLQQVKSRCEGDFDNQVKFDLEYIKKQSLWLDLKIMLLTPLVVLKHRGAV